MFAKNDPIAKLLMSVPGIGAIVAMTIVAEVGDISRFRSYRNLASYAGLVPSLDASGGNWTWPRLPEAALLIGTPIIECMIM